MKLPSPYSIDSYAGINGVIFVILNVFDAWLSKELIDIGWHEVNPIIVVGSYGTDIVLKGLIALAIALVLVRFGKGELLKTLNVCMLILVGFFTLGLLLSVAVA